MRTSTVNDRPRVWIDHHRYETEVHPGVAAASDIASLEALRERYRTARGQLEERWLIARGRDNVSAVVAFSVTFRTQSYRN
jgi:hypothetical protein